MTTPAYLCEHANENPRWACDCPLDCYCRAHGACNADEAPTRPDLPATIAATRCRACGRVFGDHAELFPRDTEAACLGLRERFDPEEPDGSER